MTITLNNSKLEIIQQEQQGEIDGDSAHNSSLVTWLASVESIFELPTPAQPQKRK
jgi:hypothetical protein